MTYTGRQSLGSAKEARGSFRISKARIQKDSHKCNSLLPMRKIHVIPHGPPNRKEPIDRGTRCAESMVLIYRLARREHFGGGPPTFLLKEMERLRKIEAATLQRLDERLLRLKLHDLRANVTQVLLGNGTHGGNRFDVPRCIVGKRSPSTVAVRPGAGACDAKVPRMSPPTANEGASPASSRRRSNDTASVTGSLDRSRSPRRNTSLNNTLEPDSGTEQLDEPPPAKEARELLAHMHRVGECEHTMSELEDLDGELRQLLLAAFREL